MARPYPRWLRTRLAALAPLPGYSRFEGTPTAQEVARRAEYKLDANENILLPRDLLVRLLREVAEEVDIRLYPGEDVDGLAKAIARQLQVPVQSVLLGSGSSQPLDFLATTLLRPGTRAVSVTPTFGIYEIRSRLAGAQFLSVPLRPDFTLDLDRLLVAARTARLVFLSSPNNPTGNQFPLDAVEALCKTTAGVVVLDEAYVDFAERSGLVLLRRYPNLVILRTFSKALGLANLRLGYMVADPMLARPFREKVQYPYAVSALTARLALRLLAHSVEIQRAIALIKAERRRLFTALTEMPAIRVFPSDANFLFIVLGAQLQRIYEACLQNGIVLRKFGDVLPYRGCVRVTVGPPEANDRFLHIVGQSSRGR